MDSLSLLGPQSATRLSPFSPFCGRAFKDDLDDTVGTPTWIKDDHLSFGGHGMTPLCTGKTGVTPIMKISNSPIDDEHSISEPLRIPRVIFKDESQVHTHQSPGDLDSHHSLSEQIKTPFTISEPEGRHTKTVVTGSGPIRFKCTMRKEETTSKSMKLIRSFLFPSSLTHL
jgi:hypothetical protein